MHNPATRPPRATAQRRQVARPWRGPFALALVPLLLNLHGTPAQAEGPRVLT